MRIAVVGGGLSGIRAALTLGRAGHAVTLLEKNRHLGGRVFSFEDPEFGEVDIGQHVWLKCCDALERLLADLAVPESLIYRQPALSIPYRRPGGEPFELRAGPLPFPFHLLPGMLRFPGMRAGDLLRLAAGMARARLYSNAALEALDDESFAAWLARAGQTPAAIDKLWSPLVLSVCNQRPAEVSARHALFTFRGSLLRSRHAADICLLRAPLSEVFDRRARAALAGAGVRVLAGAAVRELQPGPRPAIAWTGGEPGRAEFDAAVLAAPPAAARALLPTLPAPLAPDAAIAGLLVKYAAPVMDGLFFAALDSPVQWVFNKSAIRGEDPRGPQTVELVISGAESECAAGGDATAALLLPALARLLPRAEGTPILARRFTAHRAATFAMPPGAEEARRPVSLADYPGLFFAGDHAATGWPSTMESAVRAGENAAAAAMERRA